MDEGVRCSRLYQTFQAVLWCGGEGVQILIKMHLPIPVKRNKGIVRDMFKSCSLRMNGTSNALASLF